MKLFLIIAGMLTMNASAAPVIQLSGKVSSDASTLYLDIYATTGVELRSFGIKVNFDAERLSPATISRNDGLFFLAATPASHPPYAAPAVGEKSIRIVGARFLGTSPGTGVAAQSNMKFLLASLKFTRLQSTLPAGFSVNLAGPVNYASFVGIDGQNYDNSIGGLDLDFTPVFCPLSPDTDNDGLPDEYELAVFGKLSTSDGKQDSDGDGMTDKQEWIAGTDPMDPASRTDLSLTRGQNSSLLSWAGQPGRTYRLMWSTDLSSFTPVAEGIAPSLLNQIPHTTSAARSFYRLEIESSASGR